MAAKANTKEEKPKEKKLTVSDKVIACFNARVDKIKDSLPEGVNMDKVVQSLVFELQKNPDLAKCSVASLFVSTVKCLHLGFDPFSPRKLAYLIPYNNTQKDGSKLMEAQLDVSYMGLIDLAHRSGNIKKLYARVIREHDKCDIVYGTNEHINHVPAKLGERGDDVGYYAVVIYKDDTFDFEVMDQVDLGRIQAKSKAKNSPAWKDWRDEMGKKSVIRRLTKRVSLSVNDRRFETAVALGNQLASGEAQDLNIIDVENLNFDGDELTDNQTGLDRYKNQS